jgi:hypothetical protein
MDREDERWQTAPSPFLSRSDQQPSRYRSLSMPAGGPAFAFPAAPSLRTEPAQTRILEP